MIQIQLSTLINRYQLLSTNMSQIYPISVPGVDSGQFLDRNILSPMALFLLVTASFFGTEFLSPGMEGRRGARSIGLVYRKNRQETIGSLSNMAGNLQFFLKPIQDNPMISWILCGYCAAPLQDG